MLRKEVVWMKYILKIAIFVIVFLLAFAIKAN